MKRTRLVLATAVVTTTLALTGCGSSSDGDPLAGPAESKAPSDTIVVGSANFPENVLLAEIYAGALKAKGVKVSTKLNIGSREAYVPGLQDGSLDVIPDYSGNLLTYFKKDATEVTSEDVFKALPGVLPEPLQVLPQSAAEDKDTLTVTSATADKYHLTTIDDLKPVASKLVLGAGPEFKTRYQGVVGLEKVYGLKFKAFAVSGPPGSRDL